MLRILVLLTILNAIDIASAAPQGIRCSKVVDIVMVVDESGSVGKFNFGRMKVFLKETVSRFSVSPFGAHFALVTFNRLPRQEFGLTTYQNADTLLRKIDAVHYNGGSTYTGKALTHVNNEVLFKDKDRPNVPNVVIILSDGKAYDQSVARRQVAKMKQKGVVVLAIAMGKPKTVAGFKWQLQELVSKPEYLFESSFDALQTIEDELVKDVCDAVPGPCKSGPCKNGGKCSDSGKNEYQCTCTEDYEGKNCETYKDPCKTVPCQNGGKCSRVSATAYQCTCTEDYEGKNCETYKDPCSTKPCQNGGKCSRLTWKDYKCQCPSDYVGNNCERPIKCDKMDIENVGCYTTTKIHHIRQLLFNARDRINWREGWDDYLDTVKCECSEAAAKKNFKYFWIEFYGECWGLEDVNFDHVTYNQKGCWSKRPTYTECDPLSNKPCVGVRNHGFIYRIKEPNTTTK